MKVDLALCLINLHILEDIGVAGRVGLGSLTSALDGTELPVSFTLDEFPVPIE